MANKHKHYDCIIAFANGENIQYRGESSGYEWFDLESPSFDGEGEYRVEPEVNPESLIGKVVIFRKDRVLGLITLARESGICVDCIFYEHKKANEIFENLNGTALI